MLEGMEGELFVTAHRSLITFCHPAERDNWGNSLLLYHSKAGIQISLTSTFCLLGVSQVSPSVGEARLFLREAGRLRASHSIVSHFQWPRFSSRLFCQDSQYVFQEPIIDVYCYICYCYTASSRAQTPHQLSEQCQVYCHWFLKSISNGGDKVRGNTSRPYKPSCAFLRALVSCF